MTQHADPTTYRQIDTVVPTAPAGLGDGGHIPARTSGVGPPGAPTSPPAGLPMSPPVGFPMSPPPGVPMSPPAGFGPLPMPHFEQHPLATAPEPPMNTMAVLSVVSAFVISPVAIVLGLLARRQIARSGERGRGLALLGTILGSVFSLVGIASTVVVLMLAGSAAVTIEAGTTSPSAPYSAPAPVPSAPSVASVPSAPAPASSTSVDAQSTVALLEAYSAANAAATELGENIDAHEGDLDALQQDFAAFRSALQDYRTAVAAITFPADQQGRVDGELLPAIDTALDQLDTMTSTSSTDTFVSAYERFGNEITTIDEVTQAVLAA